jgi:hypothetical protein
MSYSAFAEGKRFPDRDPLRVIGGLVCTHPAGVVIAHPHTCLP